MDPTLALPILGTISLATGLLMPIRDGRHGRRATIGGEGPVRTRFFTTGTAADVVADASSRDGETDDTFRLDEAPGSLAPVGSVEEPLEPADENDTAAAADAPAAAVAPTAAPAREPARIVFPRFDDEPVERPPSAVAVRFTKTSNEDLAPTIPDEILEPSVGLSTDDEMPSEAGETPRGGGWRGRLRQLLRRPRSSGATIAVPIDAVEIDTVRSSDDSADSTHETDFAGVLATLRGSARAARSNASETLPRHEPDGHAPPAATADGEDDAVPADHARTMTASPVDGCTDDAAIGDRSRTVPQLVPDGRPIDVSSRPRAGERAVPLTRLPLRPVVSAASWTERLEPPEPGITVDRRLALLRSAVDARVATLPPSALLAAWDEERGEARTHALRLLVRTPGPEASAAAIDALRSGTEDERALAIDGLAASGEFAEIEFALSDRTDAIVARAALATSSSRRLDDFRQRLGRHLDPARREAVLALLSGVLE